jgi:hypothetical protein
MLTLRVCASISGDYTVLARGAVPTRELMLRVKGAPATAPTGVSAQSPRPAEARVTWAAPGYDGGARVTSYRVTARLNGHKPKVALIARKHFRASSMVHMFTALTRAKTWTFRGYAITRHGTSQPAACQLRVP